MLNSYTTRSLDRALVLVIVATSLAGCVDKVALAGKTAATAFSCPHEEVVVTPVDEHNYRVAGCGKEDLYYCHSYDLNPGTTRQQVRWTCESTEVVIARSQHENECARVCSSGRSSCMSECNDSTCDSMCNALADGCYRGCTGS